MNQIATNTFNGDISTLTTVFTSAGLVSDMQILFRVTLTNIAGNGVYGIRLIVDGKLVVPVTNLNVPNGSTAVTAYSRESIVKAGETFSVQVTGQGGDTSCLVTTTVYDITPVSQSQLTGTGAILVDHNYPGPDDMLVLDGNGAGIVGACIYIYTQADFDAGNMGPEHIVAQSSTTTHGAWALPVALDVGDYVAWIFKQGVTAPASIEFTVTAP